jgi:hypothetical protein
MIKRILSLIYLALVLSACAMNAANNYGAVNIHELYQREKQYGVVVFRSMNLDDESAVYKFAQDNHSIILGEYDTSSVFAKKAIEDKHGVFYFGYQIGGNEWGQAEGEDKKNRFTIRDGGKDVIGTKMPEFFYTIKMLPEGEYYFARIDAGGYIGYYNIDNTPFRFYVKPGYINYLGDFFVFSPSKDGFWSNTYSSSTKLLNKSQQAERFMKEYHPEINLPFTTNLIQTNLRYFFCQLV